MRNFFSRLPCSPSAICFGMVGISALIYVGLIAVVMNYAALTIEFSQSVKNDEATVATLESQYLSAISSITATDYATAGYTSSVTKTFVPKQGATALR